MGPPLPVAGGLPEPRLWHFRVSIWVWSLCTAQPLTFLTCVWEEASWLFTKVTESFPWAPGGQGSPC